MSAPKPTMHRPVPMKTRVIIPALFLGKEVTGTVVGVAACNVLFHYIVLLDDPYPDSRFGEIQALSVSGCQLKNVQGEFEWSFETPEDQLAYLKEIGNV